MCGGRGCEKITIFDKASVGGWIVVGFGSEFLNFWMFFYVWG